MTSIVRTYYLVEFSLCKPLAEPLLKFKLYPHCGDFCKGLQAPSRLTNLRNSPNVNLASAQVLNQSLFTNIGICSPEFRELNYSVLEKL